MKTTAASIATLLAALLAVTACAQVPTAPAAPVQAIKGRSAPAASDPDKMSDEQWVKWRQGQLAKAGRR